MRVFFFCNFVAAECAKHLPFYLQAQGRYSKCVISCVFIVLNRVMLVQCYGNAQGFSPVCVLSCVLRCIP